MEQAHVNLWELITTVAGGPTCGNRPDLPNADKCRKVQELTGCSFPFGSELDLTVNSDGTWTVNVFAHEDRNVACVELTIFPDGRVEVTRKRTRDDVHETRTVTF